MGSLLQIAFAAWALALAWGCQPDQTDGLDVSDPVRDVAEDGGDGGEVDAGGDVDVERGDTGATDATDGSSDLDGSDAGSEGRARVEASLDDAIEPTNPSESDVRVWRVETVGDRAPGPVSRATAGDYVLENSRSRFVVAPSDGSSSPCPYGGDLVDVQYKGPDGSATPDVLGEICPMFNVGQSFYPERIEVMRDGSETGSAVLAATGRVEILDIFNPEVESSGELGALVDAIPFDPADVQPIDATVYYVLNPGESRVRVVTAMRNRGDSPVHTLFGHVLKGGGTGAFFNPLNSRGGFGSESIDVSNAEGDPLPFIAFRGEEASYAYVPETDPSLSADLPIGGLHVTISSNTVSILGVKNLIETLLSSRSAFERKEGIVHLEPGETTVRRNSVYVGDGSLATTLDEVYSDLEVETGELRGRVVGPDGDPVSGARVTAIDGEGRGTNQDVSGEEGRFAMAVPPGEYRTTAWKETRRAETDKRSEVTVDGSAEVELELPKSARLAVNVESPEGEPVPGRVSVACVDGCAEGPSSAEQNVGADALPGGFAAIEPVRRDGRVELDLPPGSYRVAVTRGVEWSMWPKDVRSSRGHEVELARGEITEVEAEIARVVDTSGALAGDFHVHGVRSPDSRIGKLDRVRNFVSEGVEVLVSTDHDVVTNYGPTIREADLGEHVVNVPGEEISTTELGHYNAYPVPYREFDRDGGAADWTNGFEPNMNQQALFDWVHAFDGPRVAQVNHPERTIPPLKVDMLEGVSTVDPEPYRIPDDPPGGGNGLWSEDFDTIEVLNGKTSKSLSDFWGHGRWWLTLIGKGLKRTGMAVTDTHSLHGHLGGLPRSYVFVPESAASPSDFDRDAFVESVRSGRVVGSNGPFFRFELASGGSEGGETVGLGETLRVGDGEAVARVEVQVPAWMDVDRVDLFSNLESVVTSPGEKDNTPFEPTETVELTDEMATVSTVASGARDHRRKTWEVEVPMTFDADAWVVALVRAEGEGSDRLWPLVPGGGSRPFAFSNPIYVDRDGGGYDDPPLADYERGDGAAEREGADASRGGDHPHPHGASTHGKPTRSDGPSSGDAPADGVPELFRQVLTH